MNFLPKPRPMFQRRHHRVIARLLAKADTWADITEELVALFQEDNPGFDMDAFKMIVIEPELLPDEKTAHERPNAR